MKFYTYRINDRPVFSLMKYDCFQEINPLDFFNNDDLLFFLGRLPVKDSRSSFCVSDSSMLFLDKEDISLLDEAIGENNLAELINKKIYNRQVKYINTNYPDWQDLITFNFPSKWRINLLALGDVGSTLLIGLKLLGGGSIDCLGIFDTREQILERWEMELNQISLPFNNILPEIKIIKEADLFDCDMFVFCASKGVPSLESKEKDVRMVQFEENAKIIKKYAMMAKANHFKGLFAVVSDPVDQLCYVAFNESNRDNEGVWDYKGLRPEQIKGYGLGVMNARALYFSAKDSTLSHYKTEGRAFGPHGKGLIIADSILHYNHQKSIMLTDQTIRANLRIRELGFKPYVAPALSSGAISIIHTITGQWHYSSNFLAGVYMGSKNRNIPAGLELERIPLHEKLSERIDQTYRELREFNEKKSLLDLS
jgi:hypothetical protein